MFSPERQPHPCVFEIKYLQQPARISLPKGTTALSLQVPKKSDVEFSKERGQSAIQLKVSNRYSFLDLSHLRWTWKIILEFHPNLVLDGSASRDEDNLNIDISHIVESLVDLAPPNKLGSVYLNVEGALASDQSWASAGHKLVLEQFPIQLLYPDVNCEKYQRNSCTPKGSLTWTEDSRCIRVSHGMELPTVVAIQKETGAINEIVVNGRNILLGQGVMPNFTRATTDNDRGGMELVLDFLRLNWARPLLRSFTKHLFSYEMHWRDHGVSQDLPPSCVCTQIKTRTVEDSVEVETNCSIQGDSGKTILACVHTYTFLTDGSIHVKVKVQPSPCIAAIPSLPRIGLSFVLDSAFYRIKYFGRGPHENYFDRQAGAHLGSWSTTPSQMGFDYIVPSENGNRSECKWVSFQSDDTGFIVSADLDHDLFSFSALLHTGRELHMASHTNHLEQRVDGKHPVSVNIDHRLMGLGGDVR